MRSGRFARQWIRENAQGRPNYQKLLAQDLDRQIEQVGTGLRARMPWLQEKRRGAPAASAARAAARRAVAKRAVAKRAAAKHAAPKSLKKKPLKRGRPESAAAARHAA